MLLVQLARLFRRFRARRWTGFAFVGLLLALAIVGNAVTFHTFDRAVAPQLTWGDAFWYSFISITTIGYGDFSAHTPGARVGTVVFIALIGLTTFSVFFGMLIDWFSQVVSQAQKGLGRVMAKEHVLIVNFPSATRVRQLIDELRADPDHAQAEVVIVADALEELPFTLDGVLFVRGSVHDAETYERARVRQARFAVVLSRDYSDPNSDAIVAAAAGVIDSLHPEIQLVAECLDERHRALFTAVRCDAIVPGLHITGNLLVQESHDPGVAELVQLLTSSQTGATLYSTQVTTPSPHDYATLAKRLVDHGFSLLAVRRGAQALTRIGGLSPQTGDTVLYVADARRRWPELLALASESPVAAAG
jgi:voltage-gated potassium channel